MQQFIKQNTASVVFVLMNILISLSQVNSDKLLMPFSILSC